jgi:hypothetical protein
MLIHLILNQSNYSMVHEHCTYIFFMDEMALNTAKDGSAFLFLFNMKLNACTLSEPCLHRRFCQQLV